MSLIRDLNSQLNIVGTVPTAAAAGTVSLAKAFRLDRATSGVLRAVTGAATGTPSAVSFIGKLMVADDDGDGAPGSFALYTGPDGVAASVTLTTASAAGSVAVHIEGSVTKKWGQLYGVTSFTAGTSPTLVGYVEFIMNDLSVPAAAVVFAA